MASAGQLQGSLGFDNGTNCYRFHEPRSLGRLLDAVNSIIACLAVLGNGLVIAVMLLRRRVFGSLTNRLILHQSVIDCADGVVFFLLHVVIKSRHISVSPAGGALDQLACRLLHSDFVLWCIKVASTYNHVTISLERFAAVCHPVTHRNNWARAGLRVVVPAVWTVGCAENVPLLLFNEAHRGCCRAVPLHTGWDYFLYAVPIAVEYVVPITVMVFAYTRILIALTKKIDSQASAAVSAMSKAKRNLIVTTLIISVSFVLCWTPAQVYYFRNLILHDGKSKWVMYRVLSALLACNALINPVVCCLKYQHFRAQLRILVATRFHGNRVHVQQMQ